MKKLSSASAKKSRNIHGITRAFIAALSRQLALAALAACGLGTVQAANFTWDPTQVPTAPVGGTGQWDTSLLFWSDGATDVFWPNGAADVAIFGGTAGTVTINTGTGISANGLTFNTTGYIINGNVAADVLTLIGTTPTITVTNAADTATINAIIAGTAGLTTGGAGRLVLSGVNTFTGGVVIGGGTLSVGLDSGLGDLTNGVTINGGALQATGTFTSARAITLGAPGGGLDVTAANILTLSTTLVANANALTKTGTGTLTLAVASTRTGITAVNGGTLTVNDVGALGTGDITVAVAAALQNAHNAATQNFAANVTLNGGSFIHNPAGNQQLNFAAGKILTVGALGGTVQVSPGTGAASKILLTAGQLAGSGELIKTGTGVLQLNGANAGFTGLVTINAGTIEFQNVDSLGTAATTVTINNGGDLATGGVTNRNNVTLNIGGTISANAANAIYSGAISMAGNATAALRLFQTTATAQSFTISGTLSGSGNLTATAPAAATLTLTGSRAGHNGQVIAGANATVVFSNASTVGPGGIGLTGGTAQVRAINSTAIVAGSAGLNATYYNFGSNPGTGATNFAVDSLYLAPRTFSRTDANVNMPQPGALGDYPIVPVPGFAVGLALGGQNDGVMWKGLLNITNAGNYQFSGTNDDNYVLIIDGVQVGTLGVIATNTNIGTAVALSAGAHSIVVKHTQGTGGGYATLSYNGGAGSDAPATVIVPASAFTTGSLPALDLGPLSVAGGTLDIIAPSSTSGITLGNGTFTLTSATIDNLTVLGASVINAATPTLAPTTVALIFTGAIGQDVAGRALTIAGPHYVEFQSTNTYTGLTTVTGGQLRLNAAGGNSVAGNLTINAANANGALNNVVLQLGNQIADTATLTMTAGILSLGANDDTVANLTMNGGFITGTGTLTVANAATLAAGTISPSLAGFFTLNKTGTGTATLSGNNSYIGLTNVTAGILNASGVNALGAGGAGNDTVVTSGASLRTLGGISSTENVTFSGAGIAGDGNEAALRNLAGTSNLGNLTTGAVSLLRVDSGEVIVNGTLDVTLGSLTKTGSGALTFASNQATIPAVTFSAGALGFSGLQSFGTATVPASLAYRFDTDPGPGVTSITVPAGTAIIGGYAADNAFVGKIDASSAGALLLSVDNANALDFTGRNVALGATGLVRYSGALTPNAAGYSFGGIAGQGATLTGLNELTVSSVLGGTSALTVSGGVFTPAAANTFTGTVSITGGVLRMLNSPSLGNVANGVTLNGGTLQVVNLSDNTGAPLFGELGNPVNGGARTITIGASGGTIDVPARQQNGSSYAITGLNALTGTGTLTKTGLGFLFVLNASNLTGGLTIAPQGGTLDVRSAGTLAALTGPITIGQSGLLNIDGQNGLGQRQFIAGATLAAFTDRISNASAINLNGGSVNFTSRAATLSSAETFGAVNLGVGQSAFNTTSSTGGNSSSLLTYASLNRVTGSTLRFGGTPGTYGVLTANNTEYIFNGQATAAILPYATNVGTVFVGYNSTTGILLSTTTAATTPAQFIAANIADQTADVALTAGANFEVNALRQSGAVARNLTFGGQTDTLFLTSGAYLSDGAAFARNIGTGGAAVATNTQGQLTAGPASGNASPRELFLHNNANTLTVNSTIVNNNGQSVTVVKDLDGTVTLRPNVNITATWAINVNSFLVADTSTIRVGQIIIGATNSGWVASIVDGTHFTANAAPTVAGTAASINLGAPNTYSGGTFVTRGTLNVNAVGGLGNAIAASAPTVQVKNATLVLNTIGAVAGTLPGGYTGAVFSAVDQATIQLATGTNSTAGNYATNATERYAIESGSAIYGSNANTADRGINSLTRVATPTSFSAGGQIYLAPGAIVRHTLTNAPDQGTGSLTIKNLGTAADLFYAPANFGGVNQTLTVGAGTPWRGVSSDRNSLTWTGGTIFANSDFVLQGLLRDGGYAALTLGGNSATAGNIGGIQIVNNSAGPITASVVGNVVIGEDEPVQLPSNLTFVLTPGSTFQPNSSQALGFGATQAKVLVQAGGTLDPGNYVALGANANTTRNADGTLNGFQNLPYALISPVNGPVTVEAGGRFLLNDASGIGSAAIGSYTLKTDSILELGNANAFYGRGTYGLTQTGPADTTGVANPGQFSYETGVITRISADNIYKLSQFVSANAPVIEIFAATRTLTNQNNPFIIPAIGTPTIAPEDITIANGTMLTGDNTDRQISEGRGRIIVGNGGILAATSQSYLNIQEGLEFAPGATVTIGSTKYVDGNPKLGGIQLVGPNSNLIPDSVTFNMLDGTQFAFGAVNVWPDTRALNLALAVTAFPSAGALALQPGNGTSLLLNVANFAEVVGQVTGNGAIIANGGGEFLGINSATNFTSNVVFKNTNGQQANLWKIGAGVMFYTGVSDSTGQSWVAGGELRYTGTGASLFVENRVIKGGTLTLDNATAGPLNNRLGGLTKGVTPMGGTFQFIGNDTTPVTETLGTFFNSSSNQGAFTANPGITTIKIVPGVATTTLYVNAAENFQSAGTALQRSGTYVINAASVANGPITFTTDAGVVANGGNTANGLLQIAAPAFSTNGAFGIQSGGLFGSSGTSVAATRGDYLGDANGDGTPEGFLTQDGIFLPGTNVATQATLTNVPTTVGLLPGMPVSGTNIPAGTTILSASGTTITLSNATTIAATGAQITIGGMRNLAASEYAAGFRNNIGTSSNVKLAGTVSVTGDARGQTLTLTPGSTLNISGTLPNNETASRLLLFSSGVFVQGGGSATITGNGLGTAGVRSFIQSNIGASLFLHTVGDLNLNAAVFTDNAVVKTGAGTLNVGDGAFNVFRGSLQIDAGTVNLGTNNYLANIRAQNGYTSSDNLYLNGGTLNLGGNSIIVNSLQNSNELAGSGGTVTSTTPATLTALAAGRFSGIIGGSVSLYRPANTTQMFTNDNSYTGTTKVNAGTLILRDSGKLSGTSSVDINYATLQFDNGYLANVTDRITATAPVTLRGGTVNLTGAAGQVASQTFNALTLAEGRNDFTSNAGGSGANELTVGNLVRANGTGAFLNAQQNYGFIGTAGNNTTAIRYFVNNINGTPVASVLNDNILPAWIIVGGSNFATYRASAGIGALGNTADGFATYDSTDITTATATQNVNDAAARTLTTSKTVNSLRAAAGGLAVTFNSGVVLTLDTGGFLTDGNNTHNLTAAANASGNGLTSNTPELAVWINQNTSGINVPVTGAIDFVKSGPAALNVRPEGSYTGITNTSGTNVLNTTITAGLVTGMPVSGTGIPAGSTITGVTDNVSFTISNNTTAAVTTAVPVFGNTFTGKTIVNGGTLTLNLGAAGAGPRTTFVAVPGDLVVQAAIVTEANVANQISSASNVTIGGGGRLNLVNLAGVTETLASLTFLDGAGATATANGFDRTAAQPTSQINLTAATPIVSTNTNPSTGVPLIGSFTGRIGFTNAAGATLNVNSAFAGAGNSPTVGLRIDASIQTVPTGVAEGGLIKGGNGLLVLNSAGTDLTMVSGTNAANSNSVNVVSTTGLAVGQEVTGTNVPANSFVVAVTGTTSFTINNNATTAISGNIIAQGVSAFSSPATLTDSFNIQSGIVRVDRSGSLGGNLVNTVVQNGAVLLGTATASQVITGSVTLKNGATLGATINSFILGAATTNASAQTVLNVPSGTANIAAYDYFVPGTNAGNITLNGRLTGAGTISLVGPGITQGAGLGGTFTLGNPIIGAAGANDFSGTFSVGANAILLNQVTLIAAAAAVRATGNELGTGTINLAGGRLRFRDDATNTATAVSNTTVTYGNNVTLSANSYLDAGRANATDTSANNIISLGTLTVPSGTRTLTVDSNISGAAAAGAGNYITLFSSLDGAGSFVKAGAGRLQFTAIAPTFAGSIGLAGPATLALAPSFNTTTQANLILPAAATVPDFSLGGLYISEAGKALTVTGAFTVNANPGNNAGALSVTNTTTLTVGSLVNNGIVGTNSGTTTITATGGGFSGSGIYMGLGQQLDLSGPVASGINVAGTNTVTSNATTANFAGTQVQNGTLRYVPAAAATSSGNITVFGSPASTPTVALPGTPAIAAVNAVLHLDATSGTVNHSGGIINSGTVQTTGNVAVSGIIGGTSLGYKPGLLEGFTTAPGGALTTNETRTANPGNFGIKLEPRMLQMNAVTQNALTGHTDNDTWIYNGFVKDNDGIFSFAENIDDRAAVWIDGVLVLNASNGGTSRVVSTAYTVGQAGTGAVTAGANTGTPSQNFGAGVALPGFGTGWHAIEIRMNNGAGGSGPITGNGFSANYGFGYKDGISALDGGDLVKPIDDGTGNLFVTPVGGKGIIQVNAGSVLTAGGIDQIAAVNFIGSNAATTLDITGAALAASTADTVNVPAAGLGTINVAPGKTLTVNTTLSVAAGGVLTVGTTGTGKVTVNGNNDINPAPGAAVIVHSGTVEIAATSIGSGGGKVQVDANATLIVNGSLSGPVDVITSGTLMGSGTINGATTLNPNSFLSPDKATATTGMTFNSTGLTIGAGATYVFEQKAGSLSDTVFLSGASSTLTIAGAWIIRLVDAGGGDPSGKTFILFDGDVAAADLNGGLVGTPTIDYGATGWSGGTVSFVPNATTSGNDIILTDLLPVPEPASATLLLGGVAMMAGMRRRRKGTAD